MRFRDSGFSNWQIHHCLNATFGTIAQNHGPAMRLNDGSGDGESQTDTAGIAVSECFNADEGFKDCLKLTGWQSRALVCDGDDGHSGFLRQCHQG